MTIAASCFRLAATVIGGTVIFSLIRIESLNVFFFREIFSTMDSNGIEIFPVSPEIELSCLTILTKAFCTTSSA